MQDLKIQGVFVSGVVAAADNVTNFIYEFIPCAQSGQDLHGNGNPFFFMMPGIARVIFSLSLMDAYILEIGGTQDNRRVTLFLFDYSFSVPDHIGSMADPFEILTKVVLCLNGHAIFQQIVSFGQKFRREVAEALLSIWAIGGTAKIHLRVHKSMAALLATAR